MAGSGIVGVMQSGGLIFAGLLPVPAECDELRAWYGRMAERPSVKNRLTMSEAAAG